MQAICNLQFAVLPSASPTTPYKARRLVKLTCQYDPDFQGVRTSHATLEYIHLNKFINCKERIKKTSQYILSKIKNVIFYTWNVTTLYPAFVMSCISFMNVITKVNKENHSRALSLLVYIPDTRVLIYYQYLYGVIDVDGPWWHDHSKNGATYFTIS